MYEAAASCKDFARTPVTNGTLWCNARRLLHVRYGMKVQLVTPYCVTCNVTRLRYVVTLQMCVQLVTPYCVTHLQHYEVSLCGNVTSVFSS
jgi:hypothetical protein